MDSPVGLIWQQFGSPWLAIALGLGWFIHSTGLIGHLVGAKEKKLEVEATARQGFVQTLMAELSAGQERHRRDMQDMRERLEQERAIAQAERTNAARWRHLVGNMAMHIQHLRRLSEAQGIVPPRFDWSSFVEEGGNPDEFGNLF